MIARVFEHALPDQREALAGWTAKHHIHRTPPDSSGRAKIVALEADHRPRKNGGIREIEVMGCCVDGINLYGGCYVEPGLFESERHAASACKEVDADGSINHPKKPLMRASKRRSFFNSHCHTVRTDQPLDRS
jgi:hypothetical protein